MTSKAIAVATVNFFIIIIVVVVRHRRLGAVLVSSRSVAHVGRFYAIDLARVFPPQAPPVMIALVADN